MVLKLFHVKDPQNYMFLAADPPSRKRPFQGRPEAEISEVSVEKYKLKDLKIYSYLFIFFYQK